MMRAIACLLAASASADAFALGHRAAVRPTQNTAVQGLRGGGAPPVQASAALAGALAGSMAIPAATGIAAAAGTLAYIHQAYIFSLSYGLAMLGIGGAVLAASPPSMLVKAHAGLVAAYGARLFAFLFWRQKLQPGYDGAARLKALDKTPPLQRTPIILSTALFYALMASPLLFHLQSAPLLGAAAAVSKAGSALAAVGLVYEAVADQQKSLFKMALRREGKPDELYTGGLYATSRHANYLGEMVFWLGSFIAGLPAITCVGGVSIATRLLRGVAAGLGLSGIFFIMLSATKRLEGKQAEKWGGDATPYSAKEYESYLLTSNKLLPKLF